MSWEILRHDMAVYTMGLKPLRSNQNLIPKVEVERHNRLSSILYDTCASLKKMKLSLMLIHPPSWLHNLLFHGDTRGADHAFRSSKQTWEKIAYMRWIQPFVLLLINKEHCWIMIHLTVCQVSLLAKFSVVLHPTSAMEFQPQQV